MNASSCCFELSYEFVVSIYFGMKLETKIASGLIKLQIPNESFDTDELKSIVEVAIEYRKRVNDWLHILEPGEFPKKKFEYELK